MSLTWAPPFLSTSCPVGVGGGTSSPSCEKSQLLAPPDLNLQGHHSWRGWGNRSCQPPLTPLAQGTSPVAGGAELGGCLVMLPRPRRSSRSWKASLSPPTPDPVGRTHLWHRARRLRFESLFCSARGGPWAEVLAPEVPFSLNVGLDY